MFFNGTLKIIFLLSGVYPFSVFLLFSTFFVLKRLQQEKAAIIKCVIVRIREVLKRYIIGDSVRYFWFPVRSQSLESSDSEQP